MVFRRYDINPNGTSGTSAPPPELPPRVVAPTPPPAAPPPPPTAAPPKTGQGQFGKENIAGSAIWRVMQNLPDAYKYAMYQAMVGRGSGQNDLMGVVQHNMFGGDMNAMNQWLNYWGQTNAAHQAQFDPDSGTFWNYDMGVDLRRAQYTRPIEEFYRADRPAEFQGGWNRGTTLSSLGWDGGWDLNSMDRIGAVPWYGHIGAPPGQSEQFYATPVGTSPYTGEWGNPAAGAASFNGPVGGGYLQPNTGVHAPGAQPPATPPVTPAVPVPTPSTPTPRIDRGTGGVVAPIVTAPNSGPVSVNPYAPATTRASQQYRFRNPGWNI